MGGSVVRRGRVSVKGNGAGSRRHDRPEEDRGAAGRQHGRGAEVVALGGGHGLAASLSALRRVTTRLTAVVTVADDGGSSGRLRAELDVLPPGDLRKALAALCGDDEWGRTWSRVVEHRFSGDGALAGHAVGNLLIAALWEQLGEPVAALEWVGRLLGAHGRVLPMSAVPLDLVARVRGADRSRPDEVVEVRGQSAVAVTTGRVLEVRLLPDRPPAVPEAIEAVERAGCVVLGPGSWFTSVLPHLLVPELAEALVETSAARILTLNLAPERGETAGFSPEAHLDVLATHAPGLRFDAVIADTDRVENRASLAAKAAELGAELVLAPVAEDGGVSRHDPRRLARVYADVLRAFVPLRR